MRRFYIFKGFSQGFGRLRSNTTQSSYLAPNNSKAAQFSKVTNAFWTYYAIFLTCHWWLKDSAVLREILENFERKWPRLRWFYLSARWFPLASAILYYQKCQFYAAAMLAKITGAHVDGQERGRAIGDVRAACGREHGRLESQGHRS
jgi:hypothetical protein